MLANVGSSGTVQGAVTLSVFILMFSHHVEAPRDGILFPVVAHFTLALFGVLVLLPARLGLLTLFVSYVVMYAGTALSVSWSHPDFLRPAVLLGFAATLGLGLFGAYTSLERRAAEAEWLD